jgi:hypothetical protein
MSRYLITPVITTSAYTANDVIGTGNPYELKNLVKRDGRFVLFQSCVIRDYDAQAPSITAYFFEQNPSNSTFSDNAVLAIHATDWNFCVGHIKFDTGDYVTPDGNHRILTQKSIGLELGNIGDDEHDHIWVVFATDTAPNFTNTDAISIILGFVPSA